MGLASAGSSAGDLFGEILPWLGALAALVVVGGVVIYALRRSLGGGPAPAEGFTLHDLRRMHAAGTLSDQEFERAKAALIEHASRTEPAPERADPAAPGQADAAPPGPTSDTP